MGDFDIHIVSFPEYRGKRYMTRAGKYIAKIWNSKDQQISILETASDENNVPLYGMALLKILETRLRIALELKYKIKNCEEILNVIKNTIMNVIIDDINNYGELVKYIKRVDNIFYKLGKYKCCDQKFVDSLWGRSSIAKPSDFNKYIKEEVLPDLDIPIIEIKGSRCAYKCPYCGKKAWLSISSIVKDKYKDKCPRCR